MERWKVKRLKNRVASYFTEDIDCFGRLICFVFCQLTLFVCVDIYFSGFSLEVRRTHWTLFIWVTCLVSPFAAFVEHEINSQKNWAREANGNITQVILALVVTFVTIALALLSQKVELEHVLSMALVAEISVASRILEPEIEEQRRRINESLVMLHIATLSKCLTWCVTFVFFWVALLWASEQKGGLGDLYIVLTPLSIVYVICLIVRYRQVLRRWKGAP